MVGNRHTRASGQASVELIAAVPLLVAMVLVAGQFVAIGHALWSAGVAARAGARAVAVGSSPAEVARRALPTHLRRGALIRADGVVKVRIRVPVLVPGLPAVPVQAASSLEAADG